MSVILSFYFFPWKFNRADRDCQINCLKFTYLSQGS